MTDATYPTEEIEAALAEYLRRGAEGRDWEAWSEMFTDDAVYEEHVMGTFRGKEAIREWILSTMHGQFPGMTFWTEWQIIDGNRACFYIWNNLPDPGTGKRYGFPNTTVLTYGGDGKFSAQADFYVPSVAGDCVKEWIADGGRKSTPADPTLKGMDPWNPEPSSAEHSRDEVEAAFTNYRAVAANAVATGDWNQWADLFTDDGFYREVKYGVFTNNAEIRAWILSVMQPFPSMTFPVNFAMIDGNRISAVIPNVLPAPNGSDDYYGFDVNTILHYAGNGKFSFEEDMYNPEEAERAIGEWIGAGGKIPGME